MTTPNSALEFFPINLQSGPEFLAIFLVIGLLGVLVAKGVQGVVLGLLDAAPKTGPKAAAVSTRAPYGVPATPPPDHQPLTVGHFPRPDETIAIAYLRAGIAGIGDVILARGTAEGWLIGQRGGTFTIHDPPPHAGATSRVLKAKLPHGSVRVDAARRLAEEIAWRYEEDCVRELTERGLLRTPARLALGTLAYALVALAVLSIGAARATRGVALGRPIGFLIVELFVLAGAFAYFARPQRISGLGQRYLAWLSGATETLRSDVEGERAQGYDDVALATAVAGVAVVPAIVLTLASLDRGVAGSEGSFFTSSCSSGSTCSSSSSSCSSGGGCGGSSSSCGGGGGCGG